ncbi:MAG: metal-dependent hydrolase [Candidatus Njordarchaeales archaeon]
MDTLAHLIVTILIFGWDPYAIIGGVLPDIFYGISMLKSGFKLRRDDLIFVIGERLHSFFVIPTLGSITFLLTQDSRFAIFTEAIIVHIIIDVFTHKNIGPRFLWPLLDRYAPSGAIDWFNWKIIIVYYVILATTAIIRLFL